MKALWIGSDGRLCPYSPVASVEGLGLLVKRADGPATVGLEPKAAFERNQKGEVRAFIREFSFRSSPFRYIVILEIVAAQLGLGPYIWALRADQFAKIVPRSGAGFNFQASPRDDTRDKFLKFRYRPIELAVVVETALAQIARAGAARPLAASRAEVIAARRAMRLRRNLV